MNNLEEILEHIKINLGKNDVIFNNSARPLYEYIEKKQRKYKTDNKFQKFINQRLIPVINSKLTSKEKLILCMRLSFKNSDYSKRIFKDIILEYIEKHSNDFIKILQDNNIQEMYSTWFLENGFNTNFKNGIYEKIFNLPKFKEIVLNDKEFILDNFYLDFGFYEKLPKEYGYLIGLINAKNIPIKLTLKLYNKYFDNILKRSTQLKLLKTGILMDNTDYSFGIDKELKRLEFTNCLQKIFLNKDYYKILKKLSKKTKLDLKYIISFADKYDNTDFFIELCSKNKLDLETIKKIKYLSVSEKILNIKNFNLLTLNDLIHLEKECKTEINLYGGPNSRKGIGEVLFSIDSSSKEIRRINTDGSIDIKKLSYYGSHSLGIDLIYPEIEFKYNNTVFEKSIEAILELNSITFIIEGEACLIIIPKNINNNQKEILINWINNANKEANIAINIYDENTNKNEMLLCNEISKSDIIEYINSLNTEEKKYIYNM